MAIWPSSSRLQECLDKSTISCYIWHAYLSDTEMKKHWWAPKTDMYGKYIDPSESENTGALTNVQFPYMYMLKHSALPINVHLETIGPFTLAKPKLNKPGFFCSTVYTARKTHNFYFFGKKSACAESRMKESSSQSVLLYMYR